MERTPFLTVIAIWAAGLGAAAQFGKISVTFAMLGEHYGASGAAMGFVVSLVGFVGILFGVVAGVIVSRVGFRRALIWALFLGAAVSAYQALMPALGLLWLSRAVEGGSHLAIVVAAPTLIAQISAPRHRGLTLSLWSTFFGVAFAVLVLAGLPLAREQGPQALFAAHAVYMALMGVVILMLLPRDVIGPSGARLTLRKVLADHLRIYRSPRLSAPALGWLCYAAAWVATLTIMPAFVRADIRDLVAGAMPLAGVASSMTLGVFLLRHLPAITVVVTGFAASLAASVAIWLAPDHGWPFLLLAASLGLVQGGSFTAIPGLNPDPQDQALANGALAQMGNLGNTVGTPVLAALTASAAATGYMIFALVCFGGAIAVHLMLAAARR
ncbi:MFS transporter [Arenibacterium halophilum]|uniref:MFS transporter n=1 Tax=Arenibacterium halophilum TaxID=2583821 RepID=A0ABY2XD57_9RHOB|nr:MFS transporter [Arenibacterium halophilum]TMV14522.1 MFS transporter [Arenibacterium halophilum]